MQTITVRAPSKTYEVTLGRALLTQAGELTAHLAPGGRALVVTDSHVDALHFPTLAKSLRAAGLTVEKFVFPAGEASKTMDTLAALLSYMAACRLTRADAVYALGGGVTGDLAGLAAALYMRGLPLVQLPTTLLAAVDSSVGGKTAVDLPEGKNLVGTFFQPDRVLCDTAALETLPPAELACGYAEVIKYALMTDRALFDTLCAGDGGALEQIIARCVSIKAAVVAGDELDRGERQKLNLGHTFGHAIEKASGYTVPHGHAVAVGMVLVTRAAVRRGLCPADCLPRLVGLLAQYRLPTETAYTEEELLGAVLTDKKRAGDRMTLVVPREIGACDLLTVEPETVRAFLSLGLGGQP